MCFGRACVLSENIIRVSIFTHADNNRAAREAQHTFGFFFPEKFCQPAVGEAPLIPQTSLTSQHLGTPASRKILGRNH